VFRVDVLRLEDDPREVERDFVFDFAFELDLAFAAEFEFEEMRRDALFDFVFNLDVAATG
jgi:hypothetical protein